MPVLVKNNRVIQTLDSVPRSALVAEWLLNGNALDTSGNGYHGTVTGAKLVDNRFGEPNSAYRFVNTTDNINIGDTLDLGYNDRSISIWSKKTSAAAGSLIMKGSQGGFSAWSYGITSNTNFFAMYYYDTSASPYHALIQNISLPLVLTKWQHIVITYKRNGSFKVYTNNTLRGTVTPSDSSSVDYQSNFNLVIGNQYYFNSPANSDISHVRIYNKELTTDEIALLYNEKRKVILT